MKDARLKLFAVIVLSLASFLSVIAAMGTFLWWLVHDRDRTMLFHSRTLWIYLGILLFVGLLIQAEGREGIWYMARLIPIALLAAWAYREYRSGEFLDVAVWALGKRTGFELGLVAEMSMQGLRVLTEDVEQIRTALFLKGQKWDRKTLPSSLSLLLCTTLQRADAQAMNLAVRGYRKGGEYCPEFFRSRNDIPSALAALLILMGSVVLGTFPS
jgi:energy-coupling factor transport system permease protein